QRALYEYFVAGIKTNISLFQRILRDADFQAGRLDTGFLDRLLVKADPPEPARVPESRIAAIAAGMFAVLDPASSSSGARNERPAPAPATSNWKEKGRAEALR
ncbi:MAG: acetyl-CoA carboxylase biotin carboxylase subunit, partial [Terriglobales bacterium]